MSDPLPNGADAPPKFLDIEFDEPIEFNGKTYTVLHFSEPKGKLIRRAEQELANGVSFVALRAYQFALLSLVADVPPPMVPIQSLPCWST